MEHVNPIPVADLQRFAGGEGIRTLADAVRLLDSSAAPSRYMKAGRILAGAITIRIDFPPVINELCGIVEGVMDGKEDEREDAIDALVILRAFAQGRAVWAQDIPNLRERFGAVEAE